MALISLIFTLPISTFFFIWISSIEKQYFALDHFDISIPKGERLLLLGNYQFHKILDDTYQTIFKTKSYDVTLLLPHQDLNQLNKELPTSGRSDKKSVAIMHGTTLPIKARYRGDNVYHWLYTEKSWRFKTKKDNLYQGINKINLIIPKQEELINDILSYKLANLMGILAPQSELVNMSVNGKNDGIKIMAEQIDESFLRKNRRMPNDIYKGDNIATDKIHNADASIFTNASIWQKTSINNHYDDNNTKPLQNLLVQLNRGNYDLLDKPSIENFALWIDLLGTYHFDDEHNWILYYDNYYEKFYPIVWDSAGWYTEWAEVFVKGEYPNIISSKLLETLYNDYAFMVNKYKITNDFFIHKQATFEKILNKEVKTAKKYIRKNAYTVDYYHNYLNTQQSLKHVDKFHKRVLKRFDFIKSYFVGRVNPDDYSYVPHNNDINLSIAGTKLVKGITLKYENIEKINSISLHYLQDDKLIEVKNLEYTLHNNSITIKQYLLPNMLNKPLPGDLWYTKKYLRGTYNIVIHGNVNELKSVALQFENMDYETIKIKKVKEITLTPFDNKLKNIVKKEIKYDTLEWTGTHHLSGFNILHDNINIAAGTKIVFDENATLKILGKITAIGTKESPIIFEAKDKTKPWNTLVLKDAKANGSILKHCIFKDGSGDKGDLYEYTAMFSVHNVKNILVQDCAFYDSHRTDDMVHVIYSDATFKNSKFIRSLSDALDVDISNLTVDNCEFINSGNDAIDLMTTNAIVTNTKFTNSADKGISIGEGSNLLAINNYIKSSEIGMQSKDTSKAFIYNTSFIKNKKAVDAYHKNLRYNDGGTIYLENCVLSKNIVNTTVGKKSMVILNNTIIDTPNNIDKTSLLKNKIIISNDNFILYDLKNKLFKDKQHLIKKGGNGYHE